MHVSSVIIFLQRKPARRSGVMVNDSASARGLASDQNLRAVQTEVHGGLLYVCYTIIENPSSRRGVRLLGCKQSRSDGHRACLLARGIIMLPPALSTALREVALPLSYRHLFYIERCQHSKSTRPMLWKWK